MATKCRRVHKEKTSWRAVTIPLDSDPIWPYIGHMENKANMFLHRLPNGKLMMDSGLPRELAIKRMEDHERWCQEHREELEVSSQQLFDDMFGG